MFLLSCSGASLTLGQDGQVPLKFGAPLQLDCGVNGPLRHCFWETADGRIVQVEDVYAGLHPGLRAPGNLTNNQCGIVVEQARAGHAGEWTCRALLDGQALRGSMRAAVECVYPFVAVGGGCYYFSETLLQSWEDARSFCKSLSVGADLAVLDDCHQFQLVWGHILVNYEVSVHWIGGHDDASDGKFYWVDNTLMVMGTPFWRPNYPSGLESCVALSNAGGYFIDQPCTEPHHYVCQQH